MNISPIWNEHISHESSQIWNPTSLFIDESVKKPLLFCENNRLSWIVKNENIKSINSEKIVAIDPGYKTFATFYSPSGEIGKIGNYILEEIKIIGARIEHLKSVSQKVNAKTKRKIHLRIERLLMKSHDKLKDMHLKAALYFTKNYDHILIPLLMLKHEENIPNEIRILLEKSHSNFLSLLKEIARDKRKRVYICDENYTSKTCGSCGMLNNELGSRSVFKCPNGECKQEKVDRDIHAARNIYLLNMNMIIFGKYENSKFRKHNLLIEKCHGIS